MKNALTALIVLLAALAVAAPASAEVVVEGTGEPQFTNSAQNTQWVSYQRPSGTDAYRLRFDYHANNVAASSQTVNAGASGTTWANWSGVQTLQHGGQYGICVQGQYRFTGDVLWIPDGPNSCTLGTMQGKRAHTTIDRSKPTINVSAAGGAAATRSTAIDLHVDYSDDLAPPFPGNFVCVEAGTGDTCGGFYVHSSQCSVPNAVGRVNSFDCKIETSGSGFPDGPVKLCARAADASVPDNPAGPDQRGTADKANLSDGRCDTVVLDRTAPTASIAASSTAVAPGQPVVFTGQAADATSGLAGGMQWSWGDGTPGAGGETPVHAFEQPGTYTVELRVADAAVNQTVATRQITVTAPSSGGGSTSAGSGATGSGAARGGPTAAEVAAAAGGGAVQRKAGKGLRVLAPKRVRAGRSLLLGVTTDKAGRLSLGLARGKRTFARASAALKGGAGRARVSVPKRLRPGRHVLTVAFKPAGAKRAITVKLAVTVVGAARKAHAGSVAASAAPRRAAGGGRIDRSSVPEPKLPDGRRP